MAFIQIKLFISEFYRNKKLKKSFIVRTLIKIEELTPEKYICCPEFDEASRDNTTSVGKTRCNRQVQEK